MSVDCLVGLQYGSEGKGKWAGVIAGDYSAAVRVGAPNAGHTVFHEGVAHKMRQIPCGWVNPQTRLYVGAAGLIDPELLFKEMSGLPLSAEITRRLLIDKNAGILDEEDRKHEEEHKFNDFNGSTSEGCGQALARKVLRKNGRVAYHDRRLTGLVGDTKDELWQMEEDGKRILIEGTQGYGLCLNHGPYPFCTSRDVTASSLLSDVGFAPKSCGHVFGVMRTYPIRVAGNSGPMGARELTWDEVAARAGFPQGTLVEKTTVTQRVRRVSEIDWILLEQACRANEPDGIFITCADYLDAGIAGLDTPDVLTHPKVKAFIGEVEERLGSSVLAISTGPRPEDTVFLPDYYNFFHRN